MAKQSFSLKRYSTLKNFHANEQSIQCNIEENSSSLKTAKNDRAGTPKTNSSLIINTSDLLLYFTKTDGFFKKYSSPIQPTSKYMKTRSNFFSTKIQFNSNPSSKQSPKRKLKINKSGKAHNNSKTPVIKTKTSKARSNSSAHLKPEIKCKSVMEYYHELTLKPKIPRRTLYNHHKVVSSHDGFRTKLQKDPKMIRDSYGHYTYQDTYLQDAKRQSRIIMSLN